MNFDTAVRLREVCRRDGLQRPARTLPTAQLIEWIDDARDAAGSKCLVEVGLSTAFGCTIWGRVEPMEVMRLMRAVLDAGVDIERLLALRTRVAGWLDGVALHGAIARAGLPKTMAAV